MMLCPLGDTSPMVGDPESDILAGEHVGFLPFFRYADGLCYADNSFWKRRLEVIVAL